MPPQLGFVVNATEVQGSRRNLNLVYPQLNENAFLIPTLRPIRRRDKYAQQTRRGGEEAALGVSHGPFGLIEGRQADGGTCGADRSGAGTASRTV